MQRARCLVSKQQPGERGVAGGVGDTGTELCRMIGLKGWEELSSGEQPVQSRGCERARRVQELQGFSRFSCREMSLGGEQEGPRCGGWKDLGQSGNRVSFAFLKEALPALLLHPVVQQQGLCASVAYSIVPGDGHRRFYRPGKGWPGSGPEGLRGDLEVEQSGLG